MNLLTMAPTYGAVASALASIELFRQGAHLELAAPLAGVAVFLLVLRLALDGRLRRPTLDSVRTSGIPRKAATFAIVGLVISTAALGSLGGHSAVGTAEAGFYEDCETVADALGYSVHTIAGQEMDACELWAPSTGTDNITQTNAYAEAVTSNATERTFLDSQNNFQQDSKSVAWAKAKIAIVNSLNNNSTAAEAKTAGKDAVDEYYARQAKQVFTFYSSQSEAAAYRADALSSDGSVSTQSDGLTTTEFQNRNDGSYRYPLKDSTGTINITLWDGSTANVSTIIIQRSSVDKLMQPFGGTKYTVDSWSGDGAEGNSDTLSVPDSNQQPTVLAFDPDTSDIQPYLNTQEYRLELDGIRDDRDQVRSNIDTYVDGVYSEYSAGELATSDLLDPATLYQEASTDYNTTGYSGFAAAELAAIGLEYDENSSHVIGTTITNASHGEPLGDVNVTGTLFYSGTDDPTLTTGETYDPSNYNGAYYVAVSSVDNASTGNDTEWHPRYLELKSNFTINAATNTQTGESINTTTIQEKNYTSTNVSDLSAELDRLRDLREYYEEQTVAASSTGSSTTSIYVIGAAVLLGAGAMARRRD